MSLPAPPLMMGLLAQHAAFERSCDLGLGRKLFNLVWALDVKH